MRLKTFILSAFIAIATLGASAEDKFFIEDFSIGAGETKELAINLTNELTYTAYEAEVYLPEGMEFVYNDDEEGYAWPNYDRINFRTHTWGSEIIEENTRELKILCYTTTNKSFKGNEGAFMYLKVKTSDDFIGNHQIKISNIKFAEVKEGEDPVQHLFNDSFTEVTGPSTEPDGIALTLNVANGKGAVNMYVAESSVQSFKFIAEEGYKLHTITFNGENVTESINEYGVYKTPAITEVSVLGVAFEIATDVTEIIASDRVCVTAANGYIKIDGSVAGEYVSIFTDNGSLVQSVCSNGNRLEIPAESGKIYIVKTANRTIKILM